MQQSGIELHPRSLDMVTGTLRPLGDRLLIKPLDLKLSTMIEATWHGKTLRGQVLAAGPGEYPNCYNTTRTKSWSSKAFRKTEVKVGDIVELGGMDFGGYTFPELYVNGERCLLVSEKDICGVHLAAMQNDSASVNGQPERQPAEPDPAG